MYTYEMHCHSSQCSACGRSTAQELVQAYYEAGFSGMVLTDHFVTGNTAIDRNLPWQEQMEAYYNAYEEACSTAKALDFDVLFGIEHAYGDGKEGQYDEERHQSNEDQHHPQPFCQLHEGSKHRQTQQNRYAHNAHDDLQYQ